jgi:hypothetical protein
MGLHLPEVLPGGMSHHDLSGQSASLKQALSTKHASAVASNPKRKVRKNGRTTAKNRRFISTLHKVQNVLSVVRLQRRCQAKKHTKWLKDEFSARETA